MGGYCGDVHRGNDTYMLFTDEQPRIDSAEFVRLDTVLEVLRSCLVHVRLNGNSVEEMYAMCNSGIRGIQRYYSGM